jgi:hypothetical protein
LIFGQNARELTPRARGAAMADEPVRRPVVVGRFTLEAVTLMALGAIVLDENGAAFEVVKVDPPSGAGGFVTVWGYPLPPANR